MSKEKPVEHSDQNSGQPAPAEGLSNPGETAVQEKARHLNEHGEALYLAGNREEAREKFEKAIETDPDGAYAHNNLGVYHWESGNWEAAIYSLQKALKLKPDDVEIITNIEKILQLISHEKKAAADRGQAEDENT